MVIFNEWTNSKLEFQLCLSQLILFLHLVEFGPQITRLNLSVTTGDSLEDGIMDEHILVLYGVPQYHTHTGPVWGTTIPHTYWSCMGHHNTTHILVLYGAPQYHTHTGPVWGTTIPHTYWSCMGHNNTTHILVLYGAPQYHTHTSGPVWGITIPHTHWSCMGHYVISKANNTNF